MTSDMKPRSYEVTDGMERAPARAMLRAVGMTDARLGQGAGRGRVELERGHALQHARSTGWRSGAKEGVRDAGRLPARVRHDRGQRRHLDGPRGDARRRS